MIDSHVHIWDARRFAISWLSRRPELRRRYDVDDLMREADRTAPAQVVLVQVGDDPRALHWLLRGAEHDPRVGGVIGTHLGGRSAAGLDRPSGRAPALRCAPGPALSSRWSSSGSPLRSEPALSIEQRINIARASPGGEYLRGFRLIGRGEGDDYFERPDIREVLTVLDEHELAASLLVTPRQLTGVARAAEQLRHPVVVDHLGSPPLDCRDWGRDGLADAPGGGTAQSPISAWRDGISAVAGVDGVVLKLSGAPLVSPSHVGPAETAATFAWRALGSDRLMFGSDWPMSSRVMTYTQVTSRVSEILRRVGADPSGPGVWSDVAQRVFRLESPGDVTFNHRATSTQKGHTA